MLYCIVLYISTCETGRRLATSSVANWCLLQKSYGKNHNRQPTKILNVVHTLYVHRSCPIPKTRFACIPVGRGPPFVGEGSLKIIQLTNCIDSQKVSNAVSDSVIILRNVSGVTHKSPSLPWLWYGQRIRSKSVSKKVEKHENQKEWTNRPQSLEQPRNLDSCQQ